jgi:hypothetical protein
MKDWVGVLCCLIVIPALVYWIVCRALHIEDRDIRVLVLTVVSLGGTIVAIRKYG